MWNSGRGGHQCDDLRGRLAAETSGSMEPERHDGKYHGQQTIFATVRGPLNMLHLSQQAARDLMLAAQGLQQPPAGSAGKDDLLTAIRRMNALQIDTISVVARSPYLVLWSRLGAFQPPWLDQLLAEGKVFEYWAHAACFLPIEDFPLYRRRMLDRAGRSRDWVEQNPEMVQRILDQVRVAGETRSAEWARTGGASTGWWDWKPEKRALEHLFYTGTLMVARRHNFQRIYALRQQVLPDWDDRRALSSEEARRTYALKAVRALGITRERWVPDYFKLPARDMRGVLEELTAEGHLLHATVEGWELPGYLHTDHHALAEAAADGALGSTVTTLLSPFDPLIWDRARVLDLFGFAYRIEVYTPMAQRRYGYFTLPILHRGALVGRLDPKAHRKDGILEIRALHFEPGVVLTDSLSEKVQAALRDFAAWQGLSEVVIREPNPLASVASL